MRMEVKDSTNRQFFPNSGKEMSFYDDRLQIISKKINKCDLMEGLFI